MSTRHALKARVEALISDFEAGKPVDPNARDALIGELADWQAARIPEYGRLQRQGSWPPALPTDVFRFRRIAAHPSSEDLRRFRSSGTTSPERSMHVYRDLDLYDRAARAAARHMLFPDLDRIRLLVLAPHEHDAPQSSLEYMLGRFADWFGTESTWAWHDGALDLGTMRRALGAAQRSGEPIALLGTSFAFVHAEDGLGNQGFDLPPGSRIMQTGGYKGRSRQVDPQDLLVAISQRYGIAPPQIINEFGATELSSQMYETTLREDMEGSLGPRRFWAPPWVRATPVDPDSLQPVEGDTAGILRIDDTANLDSVCCIQTGDLAKRLEDGILVLGRAPGATQRGCSLAADQALGAS